MKQLNGGLASFNGYFYLFNGAYWSKLSREELKDFLGFVARRFGVDEVTSKYFSFKENLLDQFQASSNIVVNKSSTSVVINFSNGTLEIGLDGTSTFRDFSYLDYLTYQLPFKYDPSQGCPKFMEFLDFVLPNKEDQLIIAEFLGYAFLPNSFLKLEKALLLVGEGLNGKSTMGECVKKIFGEENVSSYTLSSLCQENGYHRAMLQNKLLNFASEISGQMDTTIAKALISGESIGVRRPYHEPEIMTSYAKLAFASNSLPNTVEHNTAFFRRFLIIDFDVTIPKEMINPQLAQQICESELPGIFNWVNLGLSRLLHNKKFTHSEKSEAMLADFKHQSDNISLFIDEENITRDVKNEIPLKELYQKYRVYCYENGYRYVSNKEFSNRIRKLGFILFRKNTGFVVHATQNLN